MKTALLVTALTLILTGCAGPRYMRIRTATGSSADGTISISDQFIEKLDEPPPEWRGSSMPLTFPIDQGSPPRGQRASG